MIYQAINQIATELNDHLNSVASSPSGDDDVLIGNIATAGTSELTSDPVIDSKVVITLIRLEEETTLKNVPAYRKNHTTNLTEYKNAPVYLNMYLLFTVNNSKYKDALTFLSRVIRFFQYKNVFDHKNSPLVPPTNSHDQMTSFKLIMDLYSPSFEEANNIWGMLGGRQLPSVMYKVRMLEQELDIVKDGQGVIQNIQIKDPLTV